jgi:GNAT superfamily N-acetyltransferase
MTLADARALDGYMAEEGEGYLKYFTAFRPPATLARQLGEARKDAFRTLLDPSGAIAGFFCLRGLDEGYRRPAFGVYVRSSQTGKGWGRFAIEQAIRWCAQNGHNALMLKVYPDNRRALASYVNAGFEVVGTDEATGQQILERSIWPDEGAHG